MSVLFIEGQRRRRYALPIVALGEIFYNISPRLCCEYEGFLLIKKVVAFQNTNTRLDTGNNIVKESTLQF